MCVCVFYLKISEQNQKKVRANRYVKEQSIVSINKNSTSIQTNTKKNTYPMKKYVIISIKFCL
jgi:hypothetical protein